MLKDKIQLEMDKIRWKYKNIATNYWVEVDGIVTGSVSLLVEQIEPPSLLSRGGLLSLFLLESLLLLIFVCLANDEYQTFKKLLFPWVFMITDD